MLGEVSCFLLGVIYITAFPPCSAGTKTTCTSSISTFTLSQGEEDEKGDEGSSKAQT